MISCAALSMLQEEHSMRLCTPRGCLLAKSAGVESKASSTVADHDDLPAVRVLGGRDLVKVSIHDMPQQTARKDQASMMAAAKAA